MVFLIRSIPILRVIPILLAVAAGVVPLPADWVERAYTGSLYLSFQPHVTSLSNRIPFALMDAAVAVLLVAFGFTCFRDWRSVGGHRALWRSVLRLATIGAVVYLLFLLSWGLNYRRVPLERRLEYDRARVTPDAAAALAALATDRLNTGYAASHQSPFRPELLAEAFAETQRILGSPRTATIARPKRSVAGIYFRHAAIDGMTVPVFLEIVLNPDILPVELPVVLAHEWSHLAGYADESEANFVAWTTGVRSADPVAQYSAWLEVYSLATSSLPRDVRAALPPLDEGPRRDLRAIAARYARSSPLVRNAARGVYDSYLKANRIEEGIANYGLALQLILGTEFEPGWKPRLREPSRGSGPGTDPNLLLPRRRTSWPDARSKPRP